MKKTILFLVMLAFGLFSLGQSSRLDSLNASLEEAISLEKKAKIYHNIGLYFLDSMQRYRAIDHFLLAYDLYEEVADTANMVENCRIAARHYWFLRDWDEMLKYRLKGLKLLTLTGNQVDIGEATNDVAFVYLELNLFKEAKEYLDKALDISQELDDPKLSLHVQTNTGHYYRAKEEYAVAVEWQEKALASCRLLEDNKELIEVLISAAIANRYLRDWSKALAYFTEALNLNSINGTVEYEGFLIGEIGWLEYHLEKPGYGIEKIKQSLDIAKEINNSPLIQRATRKLAIVHFSLKQYESAYNHLSESMVELEKNTALSQANAIAEMTARYDTEKKQGIIDHLLQEQKFEEARQSHEQALYEAQINQKQNTLYFSFGAVFLLLLLVALIIRNNRSKSRAKAAISRKEDQIKEQRAILKGQDAERQRIAQELHDGIGGSLSIIKMKVGELNAGTKHQNDIIELEEDIGNACREVRNISNNLLTVAIEVDSLSNAILSYIDKLLLNTDIKVYFDLFPAADINGLDENVKHNCYRIIQELANNAVKHAEASELTIGIILDEEGGMLRVEDNGKGFDENTMRQGGMGLKNINQRIEAINGELTLESTPGKGSIFQIQFPVTKSKLLE